jgi:hypothetical protein
VRVGRGVKIPPSEGREDNIPLFFYNIISIPIENIFILRKYFP